MRGIVVDTAFFRGNFPESCSIDAVALDGNPTPADLLAAEWTEILSRATLVGDSKNRFPIDTAMRATHLRLNIFPDGGVARLRVHGEVLPDLRVVGRSGAEVDLAALENGGLAINASDNFFGRRENLILPGRGTHMGDGWETKRRRGPGHDWSIVQLASQGTIHRVEVDTAHFKGNAPGSFILEVGDGETWHEIVARTRLQPHTRHLYFDEIAPHGPVTHARLSIFPDGGVSRLRLWGTFSPTGRRALGIRQLNALAPAEAERALAKTCGSTRWAREMAARRPFQDLAQLQAVAGEVAAGLAADDWLEAFRAHPRIGERKAPAGDRWAAREQAGVDGAAAEILAALAAQNQAYEARFGHIFIVCATGKSAAEMLALVEARVAHEPAAEPPRIASWRAGRQQITAPCRLTKLVEGTTARPNHHPCSRCRAGAPGGRGRRGPRDRLWRARADGRPGPSLARAGARRHQRGWSLP